MIFIYSHSNIYSSLHRFIWNQHINQLPVDLFAQLVEHCTGIVEVMGSNPVQAWIFSGLIFTTAQVVFITANIAFIFISKSAVHDSYIFTVTTFVLHLWFCFVLLCDWSRKLDLRFQPIRYKNRAPHLGTHFLPVLCVFPNDNWNERIEDEHSGSNVCAEAEFSMSMQRALRLSEPSYLIRVTKNGTSQYAKVFVWSAPNRMVNKQDISTWIGFVRFERAECCQLLIRVSLECCCCFASSQLVFFHRLISFFCFPYRILSFIVVSFVIIGVSYTFS